MSAPTPTVPADAGILDPRTGEQVEPDLPAKVHVVEDGPLWVTGRVPVTRSDGEAMEVRNRMTLCRCGASGIQPLCDGAHEDIGFEG